MPASPSFPSGTRGNRWKRRKRDPLPTRKPKDEDEDDDEEDEPEQPEPEDDNNNNKHHHHPDDNNSNPDPNPNPNPKETEVLSEDKVRISDFPPVFKRVVDRPHSSVLAVVGEVRSGIVLENVSYGQLQALSAVPLDCSSLGDPDAGEGSGSCSGPIVARPPRIMEGRGVVKRFGSRLLLVPMHSEWFSPATVHRLERQVVPHFFSGKSADYSPEKYMECRNHIVAKYMENSDKRLTVSDCREFIAGVQDDDLNRIVRFLDHWGIINYSAAAATVREPWNDGSYLKEDQSGEVHVPSPALKSIDSLIKFDKPKCRRKAADVYASSSHRDQGVSDLDSKIRERLSEHRCNHCFKPLLVVYYQSLKEVDVYLCSDCFHEGRFVIGHSSIDFARIDSVSAFSDMDGDSWTDQETLLLLEAVEIYNENWSEIAEHVGTKSKAQCILHFLRLPMEDGLLENIEVPGVCNSSSLSNGDVLQNTHTNMSANGEGSLSQDAEIENRIPFANSGNPVMALVAFLASAVAPRVAAACAHASLAVLSAENGAIDPGNILQVEGAGPIHRSNAEAIQGTDSAQHKGSQNAADATTPVSPEKLKAAAKAGLAAAATKAKLFADHEEREIQRLSANIINHQLKRLELKLKQFAEVETLLMKECDQVERTRQRMAAERARVLSSRFGAAGTSGLSNISGANPSSMVNSNTTNSRQQGFSASQPQPSVSGLGSNQPLHPHMSFMQRQSMFPLGPRLPLSAINPSSSSPSSNAMFNSPGSAQPTLSESMLRSVSGTNSSLG